jgi:two-component system, cell cycle sensor histidine kinase and response regulator CckA
MNASRVSAQPRPRILVVDDEESIRQFADRALRASGYETRTAADGRSALEIAPSFEPFDLLLTDVNMPGITGDELARRLRVQNPDLKVLYFTGYADRLFLARAVLWENEAFLDKPATVAALREAVSLAIFGHTRGPAPAPADPA